jgi:hypothetical protein
MTKGIPRKQRLAEQRHAKRVQGCATWGSAANKPPRAVPIATKPSRASVGRIAPAMPEPLPPAHYPAKRVAIGKRQVAGGGA